jgi:hypothetical protein
MKAKTIISSPTFAKDFLEKINFSPPLVTKEEVDKFLPKNLQFESVEEIKIWELTASKEQKKQREKGLENLFNLVQRRFWLLEIMQPN